MPVTLPKISHPIHSGATFPALPTSLATKGSNKTLDLDALYVL